MGAGLSSAIAAQARRKAGEGHTLDIVEQDMPIGWVGLVSLACILPIGVLIANFISGGPLAALGVPLVTAGVLYIVVIGFAVAAVCGYMAGLIGSSNSPVSGVAILAVIWGLGLYGNFWMTLWIIPVVALVGFCFGGMGLVMNALSPSYDFFLYYFTLVITPMVLLCGVFFPVSQLPPVVQGVSAWLPLTHAIDLARPLVVGNLPDHIALHVIALLVYGSLGYIVALALTRRRLLK